MIEIPQNKLGPAFTFTTDPERRFVCWRKQRMGPHAVGVEARAWRHPFAQRARDGEGTPDAAWICPFCELTTVDKLGDRDPR